MKIDVGTRVRVKGAHWWRAHEKGTVVEVHPDGRFVLVFDTQGIGFNGGTCLELGTTDVDLEDE